LTREKLRYEAAARDQAKIGRNHLKLLARM
jgi:hypothetical protein